MYAPEDKEKPSTDAERWQDQQGHQQSATHNSATPRTTPQDTFARAYHYTGRDNDNYTLIGTAGPGLNDSLAASRAAAALIRHLRDRNTASLNPRSPIFRPHFRLPDFSVRRYGVSGDETEEEEFFDEHESSDEDDDDDDDDDDERWDQTGANSRYPRCQQRLLNVSMEQTHVFENSPENHGDTDIIASGLNGLTIDHTDSGERGSANVNTSTGSLPTSGTSKSNGTDVSNIKRKVSRESDEGREPCSDSEASDCSRRRKRVSDYTDAIEYGTRLKPCIFPGCNGRDKAISELLRGAERYHNFYFCTRCCNEFLSKSAKESHQSEGECEPACIAAFCGGAPKHPKPSYEAVEARSAILKLVDKGCVDQSAFSRILLANGLTWDHLPTLFNPEHQRHKRTEACQSWKSLVQRDTVCDVWQYLFTRQNPGRPLKFPEGSNIPHGSGQSRPERRKRTYRAMATPTTLNESKDQELNRQVKTSQSKVDDLTSVIEQLLSLCSKNYNSDQIDGKLREMLRQHVPALLNPDISASVTNGETLLPIGHDAVTVPRNFPGEQALEIMKAREEKHAIITTLDEIRDERLKMRKTLVNMRQRHAKQSKNLAEREATILPRINDIMGLNADVLRDINVSDITKRLEDMTSTGLFGTHNNMDHNRIDPEVLLPFTDHISSTGYQDLSVYPQADFGTQAMNWQSWDSSLQMPSGSGTWNDESMADLHLPLGFDAGIDPSNLFST